MSAYDVAILTRYLIRDLSAFYHYFAETEFTWNGIKQQNRNPLLYLDMGVDGLKTGHTEAAGYGLAASAQRGDQRLILVVNGLKTMKQRSAESRRLFDLAFRDFKRYGLFAANAKVDEADVWRGAVSRVPLITKGPVVVTMRKVSRKGMRVILRYRSPLVVPVEAGQLVGDLEVTAPGAVATTVPVYAGATVEKDGFLGQVTETIFYLIDGQLQRPRSANE